MAYTYEYVDLLVGQEREAAIKEITVWNPASSFPTLVINNRRSSVGFKEDEIRAALK